MGLIGYISHFYINTILLMDSYGYVMIDVEQDTIELGKPLKISCQDQTGSIKGNRRWLGRQNLDILCLNGVSNDPDKYKEEQLSDAKYQLTINNVTEADINCPYVCRFGLKSAEKVLSAMEHNLINLDRELIQTDYVKKENSYNIKVKFHRVYPIPTCTIKLESQFKKFISYEQQSNGALYDVQYSDESNEPYHVCDRPVEIECLLRSTKYNISIEHDVDCIRHKTIIDEHVPPLLVLILLSCLIILVMVTIIAWRIYLRRKERSTGSTTTSSCEGSERSSEPATCDSLLPTINYDKKEMNNSYLESDKTLLEYIVNEHKYITNEHKRSWVTLPLPVPSPGKNEEGLGVIHGMAEDL